MAMPTPGMFHRPPERRSANGMSRVTPVDYLLIAPLDGTVGTAPLDRSSADSLPILGTGSLAMRSRVDYAARELVQGWSRLDVKVLGPAHDPARDYSVTAAWLVSVAARQLVAALVSGSPHAAEHATVEQTEAALTLSALDFVRRHPRLAGVTPMWVSRSVLLAAGQPVPDGWLDASAEEVSIAQSDGAHSGPTARAFVGWGNNAVVGWTASSELAESQFALGLVDAQYLWLDLEALSTTSSRVVHDVADAENLSRSNGVTGLNGKLRTIEDLSNALAIHNLEYDDLLMHIQGARRGVGVALLRAWNYDDAAARISRRLADTARILEQNKARQDRRYQGLVEAILFGIALAAVLELVLVAISASIDVHESGLHTGQSPFGIMRWLQNTNPDYLVLGTVVGIVLLIAVVGVARFRRR
jgi:hypothetical protein